MRDKAQQIRQKTRQRLDGVAMRLAHVSEQDDEQFPIEYRQKRQQQRADLIREWGQIEAQGHAEMQVWFREQLQRAEQLRYSDPVGSPEQESRRVSENLEIVRLAEPLMGQGRTAVNTRLLNEARRFLSLDLPDKARVYIEAARRAGVEDGSVDRALEDSYDRTVPHRRQAKAIREVAQLEVDLFDNDRYSLRLVHRVGDQVRASTAAKLLAARRNERTPAGMLDGAHGEAQLNRSESTSG